MLGRFLKRGEADPLLYPFSPTASSGKKRDFTPEVFFGDPTMFRELWHDCTFVNKDTRVVFSYHEDDEPSDYDIRRAIQLFLRVAGPGLNPEAIASCWIVHRQKIGRKIKVDVHGYLLNMDLLTGRRINFYYHKADLVRYDNFKQVVNLAHGYAEPMAAKHTRVYGSTRQGKTHEVAEVIRAIIEGGKATTREEVASELEAISYRVVRNPDGSLRSKKTMTVITPDGFKTRQKGDFFNPDKNPKPIRESATSVDQLPAMVAKLNRICIKNAQRNYKRYRRKTSAKTYAQAEADNFGFKPITIEEIIGKAKYENSTLRNLDAFGKNLEGDQSGCPQYSGVPGDAERSNQRSGTAAKASQGDAEPAAGDGLAGAIERGEELARQIREAITKKQQKRLQAKQRESQANQLPW